MYVHRLSFFAHNGFISDHLVVDHICRTRNCVNPDHMRELERGENVRIGISYGSTLTHCAWGHPFDAENTRYAKARGSRMRVCAICHKRRNQEYRLRLGMIPRRFSATQMVERGDAIRDIMGLLP
jgi:hypothetical protein